MTDKPRGFGKSDEAFQKIASHAPKSQRATAKSAGKTIPLDSSEHDLKESNS